MKPKLSIVLPAKLGYESVVAAIDAWESQTRRDELEILVVCPEGLGPSEEDRAALPAGRIIVSSGQADLHEARALAIRSATSDYVMLAEDHCLPDADWAQAMLDRLDEGWDAAGPELRPGNRTTSWAEGSFLIGYGEWMMPAPGGPAKVLCGWNVTIRTELLRRMGAELAEDLLLGAFLVRRLQQQGHRFYLESRARMRHFDPPGWTREIGLVCIVGLGFGAMRSRKWPLAARVLYPLAAPAVAFLHGRRALRQYRRAGRECGLRPAALAAAMVLAIAWALGEAMGALLGTRRVSPWLWRTEVKPVSRAEVARSTVAEQRVRLR